MRTRLFRSFLIIILIALLSGIVFQQLISRDFKRYIESVREDQLHWVRASVESSYTEGGWNLKALTESLHWAMMLGIDATVVDADGREVMTSRKAIGSLPENMLQRMEHLFHLETGTGPYSRESLVLKNRKIGTLLFRPFPKKEIMEKEKAFQDKTEYFLYISVAIAGAGALFAALLLTQYLSKPLLRMKEAANQIARGDFSTRIRLSVGKAVSGLPSRTPDNKDEILSLAESFNFMAASLQKEESLRRSLLSNISHELRTPLTIMKAHMEALEDGILEEPDAAVKTIKGEVGKLLDLIRGIEDVTLAEADFMKPGEYSTLNLKAFFAGILREQLPLVREKNLKMEMVHERDLVVKADVEKIEKIVRNLLSNAMKFTGEGGAIRVDYGQEGKAFYFEVSDTGRGIADEHASHIFDRFYRIENSGSPGLGLGLAIVKEAVAAMDGRIEVKTKVGEGTAFKVTLPLQPSSNSS